MALELNTPHIKRHVQQNEDALLERLEENRERLLCELVGAFLVMREKDTQRLHDVHEAAACINNEFLDLLAQRDAHRW